MGGKTEYRNKEPHVSEQFGVAILVVRKDTAEALADDGKYIPLIVDEFGRLHTITTPQTVANSIKASPVGDSKVVASSGTAVPLVASSTDAIGLIVQAKIDNTGAVYFGDSNVDKSTSKQIELLQSQTFTVSAPSGYKIDVNEQYIDADNNNDGVNFIYYA